MEERSSKTLSVVLSGWRGRMERLIREIAESTEGFRVAGFLDLRDSGEKLKEPLAEGIQIDDISKVEGGVVVVVDFSTPETLRAVVEHLGGSGVRLVSGTTGLKEKDMDALKAYSKESAVFYDENMSYGISVMKQLLATASPLFGETADVEIVEYHHSGKIDFPSGTTFGLARAIDAEATVISGRPIGGSPPSIRQIPAQSIRIGGIPGQHDVYFGTAEEVVCISHRALSRKVFARGALRAAKFISDRAPGMYSMEDLTGV